MALPNSSMTEKQKQDLLRSVLPAGVMDPAFNWVNRAMEDGRTPLFIASEKGHVDAARLLLDKGAEVDKADEDGETPLLVAKALVRASIVALLEENRGGI